MVSRKVIVVVAGSVLATGAWMPVAGAAPAGVSATTSGWQVQQYFGDCEGVVTSVTATGPDDAWAAGGFCPASGTTPPLVAHWDGGSWQELPPPSQRYDGSTGVAALSGSYAWIFAPSFSGLDSQDFALLRRDGRWKSFQLANDSAVDSAVAFSRSDAWGFGTVGNGAYAVRFNGRSWRRVPIPVVPLATAGPAPDDIWAVGPPDRQAGLQFPRTYALAHWTGRWQVTPFPSLSLPAGAFLSDPAVVPAGHGAAFVTVQYNTELFGGPFPEGGALLYWNGTRWTNVKLPTQVVELGPLARDGQGGIWVVSVPSSGDPDGEVVMLHRSAAGLWSQETVPANCLFVYSMRLIPGTRSVWASGEVVPRDFGIPVMVRYDP